MQNNITTKLMANRITDYFINKVKKHLRDNDICDEAESIAHNYFVMQRNHYLGLEEGAKRMAYWLMKQIKKQFKQQENGQ